MQKSYSTKCIFVCANNALVVCFVFVFLFMFCFCFLPAGEPTSEEEKAKKEAGKPQVDEIVPVYRRDCHEEVYAGSHQYPGRGVYLLKFDNSYSLWRSKSVYYRVYYTR